MKKIIIYIIAMMPLSVFAADPFFTADKQSAKSGITIVPMAEMGLAPDVIAEINEQKQKGYVEKPSDQPFEMLRQGLKGYHDEIIDNDDVKDTHMKSSLSKIKLAFDFKPSRYINPLGYAVGGEYLEGRGWTGVATYFNQADMGVCKYKINNMRLTNGAVRISKETVSYDVNNKPTNLYVEGSLKTGFMYYLTWDDKEFNHFLECANRIYDKNIVNQMLALAKKID